MRKLIMSLMLTAASLAIVPTVAITPAHATTESQKAPAAIYYRTAKIDGIDIFYREAGPVDAPAVLLLHGFPTSSHMFRNLIPLLADRYHVIAPDYPGYGQSASPDRSTFNYTFAANADLVDKLMDHLSIKSYAMYVMDYGAPVGYRLALKHPERVSGLIIQNGNAYEEGLKEFWDPIKTYWADGSAKSRDALSGLLTLETTKFQYTDGMEDVSRISPDNWVHDQALLDRPGNNDIQLDMLYDYRTNLPLYPEFQKFFPGAQTADHHRLGQKRQDLSRSRCVSLREGSARCRGSHSQLRPLPAGRKTGCRSPAHQGFSRSQDCETLSLGRTMDDENQARSVIRHASLVIPLWRLDNAISLP